MEERIQLLKRNAWLKAGSGSVSSDIWYSVNDRFFFIVAFVIVPFSRPFSRYFLFFIYIFTWKINTRHESEGGRKKYPINKSRLRWSSLILWILLMLRSIITYSRKNVQPAGLNPISILVYSQERVINTVHII